MTHAVQFALAHGAALLFTWILLQQAGAPIPSAPLLIAVGSVASNGRLRLADFDRFVFVMSVLEPHSEHDCALLLGCSAGDIREGRTRALKELAHSPHMEPSENQLIVREKK
jgi:hypothetical protein